MFVPKTLRFLCGEYPPNTDCEVKITNKKLTIKFYDSEGLWQSYEFKIANCVLQDKDVFKLHIKNSTLQSLTKGDGFKDLVSWLNIILS